MYDVIDWGNHPGDAVVTLIIGVVVCPLIHVFIWVVSMARNWIHRKLFLTTKTIQVREANGVTNAAFTA